MQSHCPQSGLPSSSWKTPIQPSKAFKGLSAVATVLTKKASDILYWGMSAWYDWEYITLNRLETRGCVIDLGISTPGKVFGMG